MPKFSVPALIPRFLTVVATAAISSVGANATMTLTINPLEELDQVYYAQDGGDGQAAAVTFGREKLKGTTKTQGDFNLSNRTMFALTTDNELVVGVDEGVAKGLVGANCDATFGFLSSDLADSLNARSSAHAVERIQVAFEEWKIKASNLMVHDDHKGLLVAFDIVAAPGISASIAAGPRIVGDFTVSPAPEPASLAILALGLVAIRKRRL